MRSKTPVFQNIIDTNSKEHRQRIIKSIQQKLDGKLIVYTASPFHPFPSIMIHDIPLFEDMLRSVSDSEKGYLMINSPGGDANAAEKILMMCRRRFAKEFNVIVPDYAKSAATLIALGSDKIFMGYLAELGPIDPQLQTSSMPRGELIPARSFIDGLDIIRKKIKDEGDPVEMYLPMLAQIRPEILAICQRSIDDSKALAEKWLKRYMLKHDHEQATLVAEWLSTGEKYKSHGKVIDYEEAKNVLKLNVEKIDENSELWDEIWELYCRSIAHLQRSRDAAKLFESETISLTMNIKVMQITQPPPRPQQPRPSVPPKPQSKPQKASS